MRGRMHTLAWCHTPEITGYLTQRTFVGCTRTAVFLYVQKSTAFRLVVWWRIDRPDHNYQISLTDCQEHARLWGLCIFLRFTPRRGLSQNTVTNTVSSTCNRSWGTELTYLLHQRSRRMKTKKSGRLTRASLGHCLKVYYSNNFFLCFFPMYLHKRRNQHKRYQEQHTSYNCN